MAAPWRRMRWHSRGTRSIGVIIVACLVGVALTLQPAQQSYAVGTLDQFQTDASAPMQAGGNTQIFQTFIPSVSGKLDQVDLFLQNMGGSGDVQVKIAFDVANTPVPSYVGTGTLAEANVPTSLGAWVSIPIAMFASVEAGRRYGIFIITAGTTNSLNVFGTTNDLYANGGVYVNSAGIGPFQPAFPLKDIAFRTYVSPPTATPTLTSTPTLTPTPTATPTLTPTATPTTTGSPVLSCMPRPRVVVSVAPSGLNQFTATVQASGAASVLQELRFGAAANATISAGASSGTGGFTATLPAGSTSATFTVRRTQAGQPVHVPLVVVDSCGLWPTFVGAGIAVP